MGIGPLDHKVKLVCIK